MHKLFKSILYMLPPGKKIRQQIAGFPRREKVVDLGCGTGTSTYYLSSTAGEVVGIDIDEEYVKIAGRRFPGIKFYCMDVARTGFPDGEFETAFIIMSLHEVYSERLIAEACRIAREVVVIDYSRILYGLMGKFISFVEKDKYQRYAGINLKLKFADHGFSLKESKSIYSNFFMHVFTRVKTPKANVVNFIQNR
ncbi:MAG: class I SAM-dependent methyltransferase [Bacillota bacterium]